MITYAVTHLARSLDRPLDRVNALWGICLYHYAHSLWVVTVCVHDAERPQDMHVTSTFLAKIRKYEENAKEYEEKRINSLIGKAMPRPAQQHPDNLHILSPRSDWYENQNCMYMLARFNASRIMPFERVAPSRGLCLSWLISLSIPSTGASCRTHSRPSRVDIA